MNILIGFLYVIEVLVCLLLGLVVMMQKPKEGGLGGVLGSGMAEAAFGADAGNILVKATAVLGIVFMVNTVLLSRFTSQVRSNSVMADVSAPAPAAQQLPPFEGVPAAPAAEAPAPAPAAAPVAVPAVPAPAAEASSPAPAPAAPAEAK